LDKPPQCRIIFIKRFDNLEGMVDEESWRPSYVKKTDAAREEAVDPNEAQIKKTPTTSDSGSVTGGTSSSETGSGSSANSDSASSRKDDDRSDGDSMWKTLMQTNFDEMLESILPELAALADKRRKAEFLDKEMKDLQAFMGEGILIGKEEARREAAARLLDRGLNPQVVAECVDLPEEEVLRIRDERS
jgi:hypothetical protein